MELEALLLSNDLSNDIVIGPIYTQLCSIKKPLSDSLNEAILNQDFYLIKLLHSYRLNKQYSINPNNRDYYLYWLENDLVYYLNDKMMLLKGLSEELKTRFPNVTLDFLSKKIDIIDLPERIYLLWKMMEKEQRIYTFTSLYTI